MGGSFVTKGSVCLVIGATAVLALTTFAVQPQDGHPSIIQAVSRHTHGSTGDFVIDVFMPMAGAHIPIECRTASPLAVTVVITFDQPIQCTGGCDPTDIQLSSGMVWDNPTIEGTNTLAIPVYETANAQVLAISFPGIQAPGGQAVTDVLRFGVLAGDVTGDGKVNVLDLLATRHAVNQPVTVSTFRKDVNSDGKVNVLDLLAVKGKVNQTINSDTDSDGIKDVNDNCPWSANSDQANDDGDDWGDTCDQCQQDPNKFVPGICGCGVSDADSDGDGTPNCNDLCPNDTNKIDPGICGCGVDDMDSDGDGTANCIDGCPADPNKTAAGVCGCGVPDTDTDGDGTLDCNDDCLNDPSKSVPGQCGCGTPDTDTDGDGTPNCNDLCPNDPNKTSTGQCGCGVADTDTDHDGTPNCNDGCPDDPNKILPGVCGCSVADTDIDGDNVMDCVDNCPNVANTDQADGNGNGMGDACDIPAGMVYVPAGEFLMGDPFNEGNSNELPRHAVNTSAFYMDRYEVTNQQYADALNWAKNQGNLITVTNGVVYKYNSGTSYLYCDTTTNHPYSRITWNGSTFGVTAGKENHPMVLVSWYGSVAYCNWRSEMQGKPSCYDLATWSCNYSVNGYRLPTEAEWEKAARGGTPSRRFPWSDNDTIQHDRANYYSRSDFSYDTSPTRGYHPLWGVGNYPWTSPVGFFNGDLRRKVDYDWPGSQETYQTADGANGYGLYDMAGNVWEWCNDWYDGSYYSATPYPHVNPRGPTNGSYRVLRGGSCYGVSILVRCAYRVKTSPFERYNHHGLRLAAGM